jgi:pilus assembly protein Flp/PilA
MTRLLNWAVRLSIWKDARGQDMVEYALMASMVTITIGALFPPAGEGISTIFSKLASTTAAAP